MTVSWLRELHIAIFGGCCFLERIKLPLSNQHKYLDVPVSFTWSCENMSLIYIWASLGTPSHPSDCTLNSEISISWLTITVLDYRVVAHPMVRLTLISTSLMPPICCNPWKFWGSLQPSDLAPPCNTQAFFDHHRSRTHP